MSVVPRRLRSDDPELAEVLALIRAAFADMEGRVDPPSSMLSLTIEGLTVQAETAEVWALGHPLCACVILTQKPPVLYLGKLAVAAGMRGQGMARVLVELACARAGALGLNGVELQTRVELTDNQRAFEAMGFAQVGRACHPGFDRPTTIVYHRISTALTD